jgi:HEAT repeat protein
MRKTPESDYVSDLLRALERADLSTRMAVLDELNSVNAEQFAGQFVAALSSSSPVVREVACKKLKDSKYPLAVPPLIGVLRNDPVSSVRKSAAVALGKFQSSEAVDALIRAAQNDSAVEVRRFGALSLGELKPSQAVVPLAKRLEGPEQDPSVREAVLEALAEIKDPAAITLIIGYFNRTSDPAALASMGIIGGDQAGNFLTSRLRASDRPQDKIRIAASLLQFEDSRYDQFLIDQARTNTDAVVRAAIYKAARAAQLPQKRLDPFARAAVTSVKEDPSIEVRKAAEDLVR